MTEVAIDASGHKGIDHNEVIKLYTGNHPENRLDADGNELEEPVVWGYKKISRKYNCTTQNIRRHVQSESKKYLNEDGEPVPIREVFPIGATEPTVQPVEHKVGDATASGKEEVPPEKYMEEVDFMKMAEFISSETGIEVATVHKFYNELLKNPVMDTNYVLRDVFKGSSVKAKGAMKKFLGLKTNISNDKFAEYISVVKTKLTLEDIPKVEEEPAEEEITEPVEEEFVDEPEEDEDEEEETEEDEE